MLFIGRRKYNLNKLKIGIGVCSGILGIALINNVQGDMVHADAINWDNQNVESSNVVTDNVTSQSTNDVKVSNVQIVKQNYVSVPRVSPQVSNVQAGQINKTKIAQFNSNSKIYGLNNSNTLSKNNGDGYVITNAGTFNGRPVDIGVTVNNINDNQGSYTTKWSNDDKANVTGKVDNDFNYQSSVLVGSKSITPQVDASRTRTRMANQSVDFPYKILLHHAGASDWGLQEDFTDDITNAVIFDYENNGNDLEGALRTSVIDDISSHNNYDVSFAGFSGHWDGSDISDDLYTHGSLQDVDVDEDYLNKCLSHVGLSGTITALRFTSNNDDMSHIADGTILIGRGNGKYKINKQTPVIDTLQLDQVNKGSLNYNYTVGVYDAQTGDLITSLKPEYKNGVKAGKTAGAADTVMNNAIKNKIADINANKAAVAFDGTVANDDVAFYQETTPVQDKSKLILTASRTITLHFPNNQRPASYDNLVNNNNQIVQTLKFTRTGITDLVTGQTTYTNWQGDSKFPAVKLPKLPGFKLQIS